MSRVPNSDLYEVRWMEGREECATAPASRLTVRRWRQEMILERAARMAGGIDKLEPIARDHMTTLENISFLPMLRRARRKAKPLPPPIDPIVKSLRQSARWHATRKATLERQALERIAIDNPSPPDAPQAIANAAARIQARRPDLPPAVVESLAAWVAGAL